MGVREPPIDAESVGAQRMAIGLAADVERLNALDDAWTGYLDAEPTAATVQRDLPELRALVGEMSALLVRIGQGSSELRRVISELQTSLDEELRAAVLQHPLGEGCLGMVPEAPFAEQVVEACSIVESEAPGAIQELTDKLRRLAEEGYTRADIGGRLKCAILLVGSGASLVCLIISPIAVVPGVVVGVLGMLTTTLAAAKGWNCQRAGDVATASPRAMELQVAA